MFLDKNLMLPRIWKRFFLLVLMALYCSSFSVYAWGSGGHRITAQIAQNSLSQRAWQNMQPYLPSGVYSLPGIATNPDAYVSTSAGSWSACLHYANLPYNATEYKLSYGCTDVCCVPVAVQNYTYQIVVNQTAHKSSANLGKDASFVSQVEEQLSQSLQAASYASSEKRASASDEYSIWQAKDMPNEYFLASPEARRVMFQMMLDNTVPEPSDLSFLVHFVGDNHQPLHVGYGCDLGGNLVHVDFFGVASSLHHTWDTLMIDKYNSDWYSFAEELQDYLDQHEYLYGVYTTSMSPEEWANEGFNYTRHGVYNYDVSPNYVPGYPTPTCPDERTITISEKYYNTNIEVVKQRLSQGGVRLGHLLNLLFDPEYDGVAKRVSRS